MARVLKNVCHVESGGFAFGKASEHLRKANRAIIVPDLFGVKIKMDNRGVSPVRKRNQFGGFVIGVSDDARGTWKIGKYYQFDVRNGWICIDFRKEVKE